MRKIGLIGLWAKESPVPYFCTAGVLGVVDEKDSRVPDTLRANVVAIRVRDSQSKVVASYVPNATGITQKTANIGTAPIRGGKNVTGTRNDDDPKEDREQLNRGR